MSRNSCRPTSGRRRRSMPRRASGTSHRTRCGTRRSRRRPCRSQLRSTALGARRAAGLIHVGRGVTRVSGISAARPSDTTRTASARVGEGGRSQPFEAARQAGGDAETHRGRPHSAIERPALHGPPSLFGNDRRGLRAKPIRAPAAARRSSRRRWCTSRPCGRGAGPQPRRSSCRSGAASRTPS